MISRAERRNDEESFGVIGVSSKCDDDDESLSQIKRFLFHF